MSYVEHTLIMHERAIVKCSSLRPYDYAHMHVYAHARMYSKHTHTYMGTLVSACVFVHLRKGSKGAIRAW